MANLFSTWWHDPDNNVEIEYIQHHVDHYVEPQPTRVNLVGCDGAHNKVISDKALSWEFQWKFIRELIYGSTFKTWQYSSKYVFYYVHLICTHCPQVDSTM